MSDTGGAAAGRVAIVGMAGRYPGAPDLARFWRNLVEGRECLTTFTDDQLREAGVDERTLADPAFVRRGAVIEGLELFDADFFGYTPREAEVKSPQQRILLEVAYEALEDAGCDSHRFAGRAGVFVGANLNVYEFLHLFPNREIAGAVGDAAIQIANDLDYLATSISHKLDLRGPSVNVQSACSTSLLAVHLAVRSLLGGDCDLALAGGISVRLPIRPGIKREAGYLHSPGGIWSSDGYTRTFDARADGTVFGSGAGVVVLKRLERAIADGDAVYAVILGTAANNDGAAKVSYTAPSADGQAAVIEAALEAAGVGADSIGCIEAHGTATALGDPIEVAGLTQAFRRHTAATGYCVIGSVKSNIGHLSAAAGVAGLTKAALALHHGLVPSTINFETPNPKIDFLSTPFRVAAEALPWPRVGRPRRVGVSAFGIGGTNVHVVLEEAPEPGRPDRGRTWQVLPLSARTPPALEAAGDRLAEHLRGHPELELADVAWTLQVGRGAHPQRRAVVCRDREDALETMASRDPRRFLAGTAAPWQGVAFLFPGQGAQHAGMGRGLHEAEPVFRAELDRCCELVALRLGRDLRELMWPEGAGASEAGRRLAQTANAQPALFAVEYALARLWMARGLRPMAMVGHSIGEYVAATLAGVFELEAAVGLVVERGRLMQELPPGAMLAVPLPEDEVLPLLGPDLDLAAVNAPRLCVVSGTEAAIGGLEARLEAGGLHGRRLHTSHAFHSAAMDAALVPFRQLVALASPRPPAIPFVSNLTGTWITAEQAVDPDYWARHLRSPVRFGAGVAELLASRGALLEVGPGQTLTSLARQQPAAAGRTVLPSLGPPHDATPEPSVLLGTLGRLWLAGAPVDWPAVHAGERRRLAHLPAHPFQRQRHWAEQVATRTEPERRPGRLPLEDWFSVPAWRQVPPLPLPGPPQGRSPWLVLLDGPGLGPRLAARLVELGQEVTTVEAGAEFAARGDEAFAARPDRREDLDALLAGLRARDRFPRTVVHAWSLDGAPATPAPEAVGAAQAIGFNSLLLLAQALGRAAPANPLRLAVVTDGVFEVEPWAPSPLKATLLGPCRVLPKEVPTLTCQVIDVQLASLDVDRLVAELAADPAQAEVALRGRRRWLPGFEPLRLGEGCRPAPLRRGGTYLVTGGLGGIGAAVAEHLARAAGARLVLTGRTPLPAREEWPQRLGEGGRTARLIRRVQALEALGAEVMVAAADVADPVRMRLVLAEAEARFGPLRGVVHAAGVPGGGLAEIKDLAAAEAVLSPKVAGTAVLWSLLGGRELDFLVLCSSIVSVLGSYGQIDYCGANAFLDAFAAAVEGPVVSVAWDAWEEVGMAVETAAPARFRELQRGEGRVTVGHPLVQARLVAGDGGEATFTAELGPGTTWALDEHRLDGRAVLPGTAYLEMARAAVSARNGSEGPVELRDVLFLRPLAVDDGATREVLTVLGAPDDAGAEFRVLSAGPEAVEHARGRGRALPAEATPVHDLDAIRRRCARGRELHEGGGLVAGGARWHTLREVWEGDAEALALLTLPERFAADLADFWLHPSLLDGATAFGLIGSDRQGSYLPLGYGRVVVRAPLPGRFVSHVRWHDGDTEETLSCDVTLMDEQGGELCHVERFLLRRVDAAGVRAAVAGEAAPQRPAAAAGIRPSEGVEALMRILGERPAARVVVSTQDLRARMARALTRREVEAGLEQAPAAPAARRDGAGPYAAPETEVEEALATLWSQVLGIQRIGVEDDFFEMGGNSLLAVQLAARIRDGFEIEFGIQHVLERSTVRRLAEVVEERLLDRLSAMSDEEVQALLEQ